MKNSLLLFSLSIFTANVFAQNVFSIEYKNEKGTVAKAELKASDKMIYIKNLQGGNEKYSFYILNLDTKDFFTVSKPEKKTVIKYQLDQLLDMYDKDELKEGFKTNPDLSFKATEKTKEENGIKLTKYTGESAINRGICWQQNTAYNFNRFIPVLRLLGFWNNAQLSSGTITEAAVTNKVSKKESTVKVVSKKETVSKEIFELPKDYLQKDFAKMMEQEKNNKDLKTIVQTFAGF
jgi:hypothetical protein